MIKKIKWLLVAIILLSMLLVIIKLGYLNWSNPDMTDKRLFITYWEDYITGIIVISLGYFGIKKLLEN